MTRRMIRILQPGAQSLVVDRGRPGQRHRGVPGGGAADRLSFQLLNWIAGNAAEAGALECACGIYSQKGLCGLGVWVYALGARSVGLAPKLPFAPARPATQTQTGA